MHRYTAWNKIANFLVRYFNINNIMYAEAWTKISSWVKNNPPPSKVHISLIFRASDHTSFIQHDVKSGIIIRSVYTYYRSVFSQQGDGCGLPRTSRLQSRAPLSSGRRVALCYYLQQVQPFARRCFARTFDVRAIFRIFVYENVCRPLFELNFWTLR